MSTNTVKNRVSKLEGGLAAGWPANLTDAELDAEIFRRGVELGIDLSTPDLRDAAIVALRVELTAEAA
jgi:hypothetical protein